MLPHLCVEEGGHLRVKGVHQLSGALDDGDLQPQLPQILRQLQADKAAAGQHNGFGLFPLHKGTDGQGILHRAQGEKAIRAGAGQGRLGGLCPGERSSLS